MSRRCRDDREVHHGQVSRKTQALQLRQDGPSQRDGFQGRAGPFDGVGPLIRSGGIGDRGGEGIRIADAQLDQGCRRPHDLGLVTNPEGRNPHLLGAHMLDSDSAARGGFAQEVGYE